MTPETVTETSATVVIEFDGRGHVARPFTQPGMVTLRRYKVIVTNYAMTKAVNTGYAWTEKGARRKATRLAKMLSTRRIAFDI